MSGFVDLNVWLGDLLSLFREADMGNKVVNAEDLIEWINQNAFEPAEPPTPPPPPSAGPFRLIWPTPDPKVVTQYYGINPQWYPGQKGHEGIDLRAPNGTPIYAAASGEVYRVSGDTGAYGIHVRIRHEHPDGPFKTIYAHFQQANVSEGDKVNAGDVIGLANNTGNSSGAHLHLTLKKVGDGSDWMNLSDIVNPVPYMPDLFPGHGWRLDVGGNFRTQPVVGNTLIRYLAAGTQFIATGKFEDDWWEIIHQNVTGWFWNPGYKAFPL